ncbi:universal stress protein [Pyruvatibacter mobilis]|jgi:nucleotide-binding universal stress UspA family protein|uniref:Universal stress protein n=1 Tax=Pyruvatibacter mobilis TaxID=1712261 RepID=A0A845QC71_9HYPH|nr:universal stress protein [Pyruvatibacter mobilis]NBG96192.1 universal stress protein [Pyruvatibacter mobilis]QJD75699.1 universal stress protein [Pyruvatibacter mobilis]GGD17808.1 universal stress protein UspA [Pyruvatibacter mobilis]
MSIKRILCPLYGSASDAASLTMGLSLAKRFHAQADILFVRPNPTDALPYLGEGISGPVVEDIIETARKAADSAEDQCRKEAEEAARAAGVEITDEVRADAATARMRIKSGRAVDVIAGESRLADLVIVADAGARDQASGPNALETCMLAEGRPVLLAPQQAPADVGASVVIGWDESGEAANAITAAMPFLVSAEKVTIVCVDEDGVSDAPGARALQEYLALHTVTAEIHLVPEDNRNTGEVLLAEATNLQGDLLVMGGYSHSRLRELVLGGVTRHIRSHATIPVLMAH